MTHLQITTAVSVVLITALATAHTAQAQSDNKREKPGANVSRTVSPDQRRPDAKRPRPGPRFDWRKLWQNPNAKKIEIDGIDGSCRTRADASLEAQNDGIINTGTDTQRLTCRMSLGEPGTSYQVSVLTDHSKSESFECAAGPVKASGRRGRLASRVVKLEESESTDRDEWLFTASRRLNTVAVRCRIPAGGVVREIVLTDCGVDSCAAGS